MSNLSAAATSYGTMSTTTNNNNNNITLNIPTVASTSHPPLNSSSSPSSSSSEYVLYLTQRSTLEEHEHQTMYVNSTSQNVRVLGIRLNMKQFPSSIVPDGDFVWGSNTKTHSVEPSDQITLYTSKKHGDTEKIVGRRFDIKTIRQAQLEEEEEKQKQEEKKEEQHNAAPPPAALTPAAAASATPNSSQ